MLRLFDMQRLTALEAAAIELERLSRSTFPDPISAQQVLAAAELRAEAAHSAPREAQLTLQIEMIIDAKAERVRQIREATP